MRPMCAVCIEFAEATFVIFLDSRSRISQKAKTTSSKALTAAEMGGLFLWIYFFFFSELQKCLLTAGDLLKSVELLIITMTLE